MNDRHIPNHLTEAILVTIFCCMPLGVVAIVYAAQVNTLIEQGNYKAALSASENANKFCNWSFWLTLIAMVAYTLVLIVRILLNL
jgi:hypothetical protein